MTSDSFKSTAMILHRGELGDIREILEDLGVGFEERAQVQPSDPGFPGRLIIGSPQQLLDSNGSFQDATAVRLAVIDKESKTLRAMMRRARVDFVVRRPVHQSALRLLILHSLYRGPEKRGRSRVSVGAPVHIRVGLRRLPAVLVDVSQTGCRLLCERIIAPGTGLSLSIPPIVTTGRRLRVRGEVIRWSRADGERSETRSVSVRFLSADGRIYERLAELVRIYGGGPAQLDPRSTGGPRQAEPGELIYPTPEPVSLTSEPEAEEERRGQTRHRYESRVIALDESATRVLLGRDISVGGMRVSATPSLALDDELQLAIHLDNNRAPLVVQARVVRDDGDRGLVLQFGELGDDHSKALGEAVDQLPELDTGIGDVDDLNVVMSEIITHVRETDASQVANEDDA